ncbi:peptidylprolyl isomerase [Asticcacaulis solisilvae]|uniref:peptidylprolyl isomerase n=1 Tax=Asticcacaulis solisilvae TaxID=1217274 RepID=UPI003FD81D38
MRRRDMIGAGLALGAVTVLPAWAQTAAGLVRIKMTTGKGVIVLDLDALHAPLTVKNFLRYVDLKKLDNNVFYRAMPNGNGADGNPRGLVQGGDSRRALAPVAHEPTSQTGLSHIDGTISLVRGGQLPSGRGDFFICVGDMTFLDAGGGGTGDNQGFAAFGHVVDGMDVVRAIFTAPVSATEGEGAMKGQMLSPRVPIVTTRRV